MSVTVQRMEFGTDRQVVDAVVDLPDRRPGWTVILQARGAGQVVSTRQPCLGDSTGRAFVRFYPFLEPGRYTLLGRLMPPDEKGPPQQKRRGGASPIELGRALVPRLDEATAADWLQREDADLHQAASRALLPLCVDLNGRPCFWPLQGSSPHRVAVLSIPKAGTYLVSKLLENLGIVSCSVHVGRGVVGDYRTSKQMPAPVQQYLDVAYSGRLVLPGQSMASHMRRELATEIVLYDYRKLFVYRDLRAALVSAFRTAARRTARKRAIQKSGQQDAPAAGENAQGFVDFLESGHLERMRRQYEAASGWYDHPEVCRVSFEDIMGDAGPQRRIEVVTAIAALCDVDMPPDDAQALLQRTVGADTQTFSGARSEIAEYWSPRAEELFKQVELDRLNATLGYDRP